MILVRIFSWQTDFIIIRRLISGQKAPKAAKNFRRRSPYPFPPHTQVQPDQVCLYYCTTGSRTIYIIIIRYRTIYIILLLYDSLLYSSRGRAGPAEPLCWGGGGDIFKQMVSRGKTTYYSKKNPYCVPWLNNHSKSIFTHIIITPDTRQ